MTVLPGKAVGQDGASSTSDLEHIREEASKGDGRRKSLGEQFAEKFELKFLRIDNTEKEKSHHERNDAPKVIHIDFDDSKTRSNLIHIAKKNKKIRKDIQKEKEGRHKSKAGSRVHRRVDMSQNRDQTALFTMPGEKDHAREEKQANKDQDLEEASSVSTATAGEDDKAVDILQLVHLDDYDKYLLQ